MIWHVGTSGIGSGSGLAVWFESLRGLLLLALALTGPTILPACTHVQTPPNIEKQNYCRDPSSWTEWEALLQKNPGDEDLRIFYALRIGLCVLVERGEISTDQATKFFERQRDALIRAREPKQLDKPSI